ncbi:MAG: hypothetical protein AAB690_02230 [Patescibacteria group bacterium]
MIDILQRSLLETAVAKELDYLNSKFAFWNVCLPTSSQSTWESDQPIPSLQAQLSKIGEDDFFQADQDIKTIIAIGWEFIWGAPEPTHVLKEKEKIRVKASLSQPLTPLETLWQQISMVDTDSF